MERMVAAAVSQHLKVLKEAGLVRDEADGVRRLYEIDLTGLGELRASLDRFFKVEVEAASASGTA
jgi:DNA-binding transcriptional ArsR family regulator